jgi:hypothetical protein
MPAKTPATANRSFDVLPEEGEYLQKDDQLALIKQIIADKAKETPTVGYFVKFNGADNDSEDATMRLVVHTYEANLSDKRRAEETIEANGKILSTLLKHLKAEYRKRSKHTLEAKDQGGLHNAIERVSLNDRYSVAVWKCFTIER